MKSPRASYQHRQWATLILAMLGVFSAVLGALLLVQANTDAPLLPAVAGVIALVSIIAGLFHSLVVTIDQDKGEPFVRLRFGWGPIRRTIPLERIVRARAVRNSWWYGWGIRLTPHGWLWNVSGLDAVELEFTSGKHFRIGTDEPKRLVRAIEEARATEPSRAKS